MAEIFVFANPHQLEAVPTEEKNKWDTKQQRKYIARYRKGDIFEIYPDGYTAKFGDGPIRNEAFAVIRLPGMSVEELKKYTKPSLIESEKVNGEEIDIETMIKYRRRYGLKDIPEPMQIVTISDADEQKKLIDSMVDKGE